MPAGVRVVLDAVDDLADLVDMGAVRCFPFPPLFSVDGSQFPIFIRPLIPDPDPVLLEVLDVRCSTQEPEHLNNKPLEEYLLRGDERKRLAEVKPHLVPKDA